MGKDDIIQVWSSATSECVDFDPYPNGTLVDMTDVFRQQHQAIYHNDGWHTCCAGGLVQGADLQTNRAVLFIWILILCWVFGGVALGAETFMTSIEVITSVEKTKETTLPDGTKKVWHTRVWNATVANLTLMALGSSAPEILLSVIEILTNPVGPFFAGPLGPSTIVGSAAYNLMVITAVCVTCLPAGEKRTLKQLGVFATTAAWSVISYIWLLVIVVYWTPEVITVVEGVLTCLFFIILVIQSYVTDKYFTRQSERKIIAISQLSTSDAAKALNAKVKGKNMSAEEIAAALEDEFLPPKTRAYYKRQVTKKAAGTAKAHRNKVTPEEGDEPASKAKQGHSATQETSKTPAGVIVWKFPILAVPESCGSCKIYVCRQGGSKGKVSVNYTTKDQTAVAGKDYKAVSGTIEWEDGDSADKEITIEIFDDDEFEKDEQFTVVLKDVNGAEFSMNTDGGMAEDICTVTIENDDDKAQKLKKAFSLLKMGDRFDLASENWMENIRESLKPPEPGKKALVLHILTVPWKLMFALVPPPAMGGGWPCFSLALVGIGFQVMLISDFASQMGCQMYLKDEVTAITFVALGTSLPDTFASMQAAQQDKTADNSIGNVTGSNAVNVLLGLGLPWMMAAIYWSSGTTATWVEEYPDMSAKIADMGLDGGFVVRAGALTNSVITFIGCAALTIGIIVARRFFLDGAELGGPKPAAIATAVVCIFLWLVYLIISICTAYNVIGAIG